VGDARYCHLFPFPLAKAQVIRVSELIVNPATAKSLSQVPSVLNRADEVIE
jgi:hypothetical protein